MSTPAEKRLIKDLQKLAKESDENINATPDDGNLYHWTGLIAGPEGTVWEGGLFDITLDFSNDYPAKAPSIRFVTKMFHPNIYNDGKICLDSTCYVILL